MSRLFDKTRSGVPPTPQNDRPMERLDVGQLLAEVKERVPTEENEQPPAVVQGLSEFVNSLRGESAAAEIGDLQLQRCPLIQLPQTFPLHCSYGEESVQAIEGYNTLRTKLLRLQQVQGIRSVVVSSSIQGEGKTTTTANLAISCAKLKNMRVLLVDGDLRTGGLGRRLGAPEAPGLSEILAGQLEYQQAVAATSIPGLYFIGIGKSSIPAPELLTGARWRAFIGWGTETFKLVVVDSPPILAVTDFELLAAACDGVILVVRAFNTTHDTVKEAITRVDKSKVLGILLNGALPSHRRDYYKYYYGSSGTGAKKN